jgi:hypothetical protein
MLVIAGCAGIAGCGLAGETGGAVFPVRSGEAVAESPAPEADSSFSAGLDPCAVAVLQDVRITPRGITFVTSAPVEGRLVKVATVDSFGLAGYADLTVEIPRASLGNLPAVDAWTEGPIAGMRISRYRTAVECGLRLRLQARTLGNWVVKKTGDGLAVYLMQSAAAEEAARGGEGGPPTSEAAGSFWANGYYSSASMSDSPSVNNSQLQVGLSERIPGVGTLRLFAATLTPHDGTSTPYAAVGLGDMPWGAASADVAAGDLQIGLGDSGATFAPFPNLVLLRGLGASATLPSGLRLEAFGGRAAQSSFFRLPGQTSVSVDISHDLVYGLQGSWTTPSRALGLGLGWAFSSPQVGAVHHNLFQSVSLQVTPGIGGRLLVEESAGKEAGKSLSGMALTAEPQMRGKDLFLGGYLRFTSVDFRPPLGSSFYASLRHSYTLYGGFNGIKRLSFAVSSGESKSFNIFDPQAVGTLSTSRSAGVGYQIAGAVSVGTDYSESTEKTDPGALLPADSLTTSSGVSASWSAGQLSTFLRYAREHTINHISPDLGLESRRIDLDLSYPLQATYLRARLEYLDSTREDGTRVGENYSAFLESRWQLSGRGYLSANVGHLVQPAGVTLLGSSQSQAGVAFQLLPRVLPIQAGAAVSYLRFDVAGQASRQGWTCQINLGTRFSWGARPFPMAPMVTRALPLPLTPPGELPISRVRLVVFEDLNGNGTQDPDEPGVAGVRLRVDGQRAVTGEQGVAEVALEQGRHEIRLEMQGPALDFLVKQKVATVVARAGGGAEVAFPLIPAGRLGGHVILHNGNHNGTHTAAVLENIRVVAKGPSLTRETLTDETGAFDFGRVPTGDYTVRLDETLLSRELVLAGPGEVPASVARGGEAQVELGVRRATARERIIEEKPNGGR